MSDAFRLTQKMKRGQLAVPVSPNNGAVLLDDDGTYVDTLLPEEAVLVLSDPLYAPWHNIDANYEPMYHQVLVRNRTFWVFCGHLTLS